MPPVAVLRPQTIRASDRRRKGVLRALAVGTGVFCGASARRKRDLSKRVKHCVAYSGRAQRGFNRPSLAEHLHVEVVGVHDHLPDDGGTRITRGWFKMYSRSSIVVSSPTLIGPGVWWC